MRGKALDALVGHHAGGITPAYAGKSTAAVKHPKGNGDHPRVCGEKKVEHAQEMAEAGSPPRMRGKASFGRVLRTSTVDHPRVCGEKVRRSGLRDEDEGSPPRMRGKAGPP